MNLSDMMFASIHSSVMICVLNRVLQAICSESKELHVCREPVLCY